MKNLISRVFTGLGAGALDIAAVMAMPTPAQAADTSFAGEVIGEFDDATGMFTPTGSTLSVVDDPLGFICPVYVGVMKGDPFVVNGMWETSGLSITST